MTILVARADAEVESGDEFKWRQLQLPARGAKARLGRDAGTAVADARSRRPDIGDRLNFEDTACRYHDASPSCPACIRRCWEKALVPTSSTGRRQSRRLMTSGTFQRDTTRPVRKSGSICSSGKSNGGSDDIGTHCRLASCQDSPRPWRHTVASSKQQRDRAYGRTTMHSERMLAAPVIRVTSRT